VQPEGIVFKEAVATLVEVPVGGVGGLPSGGVTEEDEEIVPKGSEEAMVFKYYVPPD
jgi:predicted ATP-grasp superfamily ATP-dependent carboligase